MESGLLSNSCSRRGAAWPYEHWGPSGGGAESLDVPKAPNKIFCLNYRAVGQSIGPPSVTRPLSRSTRGKKRKCGSLEAPQSPRTLFRGAVQGRGWCHRPPPPPDARKGPVNVPVRTSGCSGWLEFSGRDCPKSLGKNLCPNAGERMTPGAGP